MAFEWLTRKHQQTERQKLYALQLKSPEWKATRERILIRADGECENCLSSTPKSGLKVHHERYLGNHPSDTPDEFLIALCQDCHDLYHWQDRMDLYLNKKCELVVKGVPMLPDLQEKLIDHYNV